MGLFDGILGQVMSSSMGNATAGNNPLAAILGNLSGAGATNQNTAGTHSAGMSGMQSGGMILAAVVALVQQQGGLSAVLGKLQASGLGKHTDSWVGTGANIPVSSDDLHKALGGGALGNLAAQLGVPTQQAGGMLSQILPELVNQLTPQGQLPDNHADLLNKGLEMLRGMNAR
jgi:uncharacterized protein YidB (DUF937 family)